VANSDIGPQVKMQLDQMITQLNNMPIGMSLVWLWVWDVISDKYKTYKQIDQFNDYAIPEGVTLDVIWEKLWSNPPSEFTLEYGAEYVDEAIQDWMIDNDFLALLDDDGWLDDEDSDDVQSDDVQLNME
jgi:hypothetical protein